MLTYSFTLVIQGLSASDDHDALLSEWGADDTMLFDSDGATYAAFYRDAVDAREAVTTAINSLVAALPRLRVLRLDRDLVGVSEIAERAEVSREAVRRWVAGDLRGGASAFPPPVGVVGKGQRVWQWADVHEWLVAETDFVPDDFPVPSDVAAAIDFELVTQNLLTGRRLVGRGSARAAGKTAIHLPLTRGFAGHYWGTQQNETTGLAWRIIRTSLAAETTSSAYRSADLDRSVEGQEIGEPAAERPVDSKH